MSLGMSPIPKVTMCRRKAWLPIAFLEVPPAGSTRWPSGSPWRPGHSSLTIFKIRLEEWGSLSKEAKDHLLHSKWQIVATWRRSPHFSTGCCTGRYPPTNCELCFEVQDFSVRKIWFLKDPAEGEISWYYHHSSLRVLPTLFPPGLHPSLRISYFQLQD